MKAKAAPSKVKTDTFQINAFPEGVNAHNWMRFRYRGGLKWDAADVEDMAILLQTLSGCRFSFTTAKEKVEEMVPTLREGDTLLVRLPYMVWATAKEFCGRSKALAFSLNLDLVDAAESSFAEQWAALPHGQEVSLGLLKQHLKKADTLLRRYKRGVPHYLQSVDSLLPAIDRFLDELEGGSSI